MSNKNRGISEIDRERLDTQGANAQEETGEREALNEVLDANKTAATAAIITGPEGGFAQFEAELAKIVGLHICSMGERILRCETAPVVALTAAMYATGNLA